MWTVLMQADLEMYNASLVQRTHFAAEQEYLFTPYSVFTVSDANWRAGTAAEPHEITVIASPDNTQEPEDLPLAPWG